MAGLLGMAMLSAGCTPATAPEPPPIMPVVVAPPQPPEPPPPAPQPKPVPPPLKFSGHVASYKSLADGEAAWPRLVERFPAIREADRRYVEIDLGGERGKIVRLLLGGFPDAAGAADYCRLLRGHGLYCAPHNLVPPT